jgi:hypothetical protein
MLVLAVQGVMVAVHRGLGMDPHATQDQWHVTGKEAAGEGLATCRDRKVDIKQWKTNYVLSSDLLRSIRKLS